MVSLQMFGVAANLVSSRFVGKIPCRSTVQYTKGHGVTYQVRASMRNPSLRRRLFLRWFSTVAIIVFT
jgi:hypothetical protein